jgi:Domain of unknown function (DUF4272)
VADDEIEINPRPAQEAGRRLIVLASLCRRAFFEDDIAAGVLGDEVEDERFDILAWLDDNGLTNDVEPSERSLLAQPVGTITNPDQLDSLMQLETAGTVAWYLHVLLELPAFEVEDYPTEFLDQVPSPWDSVAPWLTALQTRTIEDLAAQREIAEIWNWRAEIEDQRQTADGKERSRIEATIRETALEAVNAGLIAGHVKGDLPVGANAFGDLDRDRQQGIGWGASERLHALNWLCGYGDCWSDVPLSI